MNSCRTRPRCSTFGSQNECPAHRLSTDVHLFNENHSLTPPRRRGLPVLAQSPQLCIKPATQEGCFVFEIQKVAQFQECHSQVCEYILEAPPCTDLPYLAGFSILCGDGKTSFPTPPHSAIGDPIPLLSPSLSPPRAWLSVSGLIFVWVTEGRLPCQILSLKG